MRGANGTRGHRRATKFMASNDRRSTVTWGTGYPCGMHDWISEETGLAGLFAASFVAATIIPFSSEAVLFGFLKLHPHAVLSAIILASVGNTLGGMTTYLLGRIAREPKGLAQLGRIQRFGAPLLALAWLPVVGDGLCLAAGWLRLNWLAVAVFQGIGRLLRYVVVSWLAGV
jgi:membrane protein YqaA with SNARE-associated domain